MKKWIYNIAWVMMAFVSLTLTSCDDDVEIARTLEGTWEGDMYTSAYWNGRYYDASYSQVCFLRDPYTYSSGTGYWVDYYDNAYWGSYNYVTSHIEFTVRNRVINIYFVEDHETVSIYDYSLSQECAQLQRRRQCSRFQEGRWREVRGSEAHLPRQGIIQTTACGQRDNDSCPQAASLENCEQTYNIEPS